MIYFDNSATSLIKPIEVKDAVKYALNNFTANPGRSGHDLSNFVAEKIFNTRENVKRFFGAENYDVIFTKNCSEALNLAIFGTLKNGDHVITTCYEHNSVLRPLEKLKSCGVDVEILDCDLLNFHQEMLRHIKQNTKMIIATHCSNVTGEMSNIFELGKLCKQHNLILLVDGAQSSGHVKIDLEKMGVTMFAFSGHKGLLSMTGVGGLIVEKQTKLSPILFGGTGTESEKLNQPIDTIEGFEVGTIPTIPIVSLDAGISFLSKNFSKITEKEQKLSNFLYQNLKKLNFLEIYSKQSSLNVFSFNVKNLDSSFVSNILNEQYKICVRSGLHCSPLIHKKLKTLNRGAVRVSLDFNNSFEEILYLINALKEISNL